MFFSVIVPVYNVDKYLRACVDSVLSQTFGDFELILVNDGSKDSCPQICEEYASTDKRVKVIHKENGGLASARHAGTKAAQGEYVFNLDGDDAIVSDTLESAYKIICDTSAEIVSFAYRWVCGEKVIDITNDGIDEGLYRKDEIEKVIYPKLLSDKEMKHISYYLSGKAVKRELLTPNQLNVSTKISLGEDLLCVFPCYLQAGCIYISKKEVYLYTVREDSLSKEFNTSQIMKVENVISELCNMDIKKPDDFNEQIKRYSCFMCFAIFAAAAEGGYFKSIKEFKSLILNSGHMERIIGAEFENISAKSKIGIFLLKRKMFKTAFYFLSLCKNIKRILKKG